MKTQQNKCVSITHLLNLPKLHPKQEGGRKVWQQSRNAYLTYQVPERKSWRTACFCCRKSFVIAASDGLLTVELKKYGMVTFVLEWQCVLHPCSGLKSHAMNKSCHLEVHLPTKMQDCSGSKVAAKLQFFREVPFHVKEHAYSTSLSFKQPLLCP